MGGPKNNFLSEVNNTYSYYYSYYYYYYYFYIFILFNFGCMVNPFFCTKKKGRRKKLQRSIWKLKGDERPPKIKYWKEACNERREQGRWCLGESDTILTTLQINTSFNGILYHNLDTFGWCIFPICLKCAFKYCAYRLHLEFKIMHWTDKKESNYICIYILNERQIF